MKNIHILLTSLCLSGLLFFDSCKEEFLDVQPLSSITPENYLKDESQLSAYAINLYNYQDNSARHSIFNAPDFQSPYGIGDYEKNDNQPSGRELSIFAPGQYRVPQTGGDWNFRDIFQCNYFLNRVLPKWKNNEISGNQDNVKHYIGEIYFLRAYNYFLKLQALGDFPIIKTVLPDDKEALIEASKREPRNEVARFILSDLDSAIILMLPSSPDGNKNRLSKLCAQLVRSRVALFEGTWLKHFKGTAFVPNGPGWPGKNKAYNANYNFPSGSIEGEIEYFLGESMKNAKEVADVVPLVENTGMLQQSPSDPVNPYYDMFAQTDMSKYSEVLMWRKYDLGLGIYNSQQQALQQSGVNLTRGYVESFLMSNGLPIYAPGSGYQGDDSVQAVRKSRDNRLWLFLKEPEQKNILFPANVANSTAVPVEPIAPIVVVNGKQAFSKTGYPIRKGLNFDQSTTAIDRNTTGALIFRGVEAYLNYMEACYEKNGSLDASAEAYWKAIRTRAHVDPDINKTITATDMSKEALDWGAYTAGQLIDPTLYNIRRERRDELMNEGFRFADLIRWRAMDQLITNPYHVEGINLWGGPVHNWYPASSLVYNNGDLNTVSSPALSKYLRPFEINNKSIVYNGFRWNMAHYLSPIASEHFLNSSGTNDAADSPIYQNPGWPTAANQGPTQ